MFTTVDKKTAFNYSYFFCVHNRVVQDRKGQDEHKNQMAKQNRGA